ncbi:hypothetical protein AGLY_009764, partial [Aphis glycines]
MEVTRCSSGTDAGQSPKGTLDVTPIVAFYNCQKISEPKDLLRIPSRLHPRVFRIVMAPASDTYLVEFWCLMTTISVSSSLVMSTACWTALENSTVSSNANLAIVLWCAASMSPPSTNRKNPPLNLISKKKNSAILAFMSIPGLLVISCLAMSSHCVTSVRFAAFANSASDSQSRFAECAYNPDGDACVTRVVVTSPTALPLAIDQSAMDCVLLLGITDPGQSFSITEADNPIIREAVNVVTDIPSPRNMIIFLATPLLFTYLSFSVTFSLPFSIHFK